MAAIMCLTYCVLPKLLARTGARSKTVSRMNGGVSIDTLACRTPERAWVTLDRCRLHASSLKEFISKNSLWDRSKANLTCHAHPD